MKPTHLISFTLEIDDKDAPVFLETMEEVKTVWEANGVTNYLFKDSTRPSRWMHFLLTEESADEISSLLQKEPKIRNMFESIQKSGSHLIVSFMERKL